MQMIDLMDTKNVEILGITKKTDEQVKAYREKIQTISS